MEGGGGLKIIHMHRTLEATIGGETLGLVLPSAGPYTPFGVPTSTNTAKAFCTLSGVCDFKKGRVKAE